MKIASIHTSDCIQFKRCRRRWKWQSPLKDHLQPKQKILPLWFGTGLHFILEDFHGGKLYKDSHECWDDYVYATTEYYGKEWMFDDLDESVDLMHRMIDYYNLWLIGRDPLTTFVYEGIPQVEVNFKIKIPVTNSYGYDIVYYEGTIDRIIEDEFGNLWIAEYKSAKQIFKAHFLTDPQISRYMWAAQALYGRPVVGCIYCQWKKTVPEEPTLLKSGRISVNQQQSTTHRLYRQALIKVYGKVDSAPKENVDFLNMLAAQETADSDDFISRERIHRNQHSLQMEGLKILEEVNDMLNPDIALYPNPSRDNCLPKMCSFRDVCIQFENGDDWEQTLEQDFEYKIEERGKDPWRQYLKHQMVPRLMLLEDLIISPPQHL